MGRFLSVDPLVGNPLNAQDYNGYSYCANNPLAFTDPSGYVKMNLSDFMVLAQNSPFGGHWESGGGGGDGEGSLYTNVADAQQGGVDYNNANNSWANTNYPGGATVVNTYSTSISFNIGKLRSSGVWRINLWQRIGNAFSFNTTKTSWLEPINLTPLQGPPVVLVDFVSGPQGVDRNEFLTLLRSRMIENGVSSRVKVVTYNTISNIKAWLNNSPRAYLTIRNYSRGDKLESIGGFAYPYSNRAVVYDGLSSFGEKRNYASWYYVNAALHEFGHAIWGFPDVGHAGCTNCLIDYDGAYNSPHSMFTQDEQLKILLSIWGPTKN